MFLLILSRLRFVLCRWNTFWHSWPGRIYYVFKLRNYVFLLLWSSKQRPVSPALNRYPPLIFWQAGIVTKSAF